MNGRGWVALPRRMRGAALVIGLLLLSALAGLGAAAGTGAVLQAQMADNLYHRANARGAAAAAGRAAEGWLFGLGETTAPEPCNAPCGSGGVIHRPAPAPETVTGAEEAWWREHAVTAGTDPVTGEVRVPWRPDGTVPARWWVAEAARESFDTAQGPVTVGFYRVYARGVSPAGRGTVVSEAVIARPWGIAVPVDAAGPMTPRRFCDAVPSELPCGRLAWRMLR